MYISGLSNFKWPKDRCKENCGCVVASHNTSHATLSGAYISIIIFFLWLLKMSIVAVSVFYIKHGVARLKVIENIQNILNLIVFYLSL